MVASSCAGDIAATAVAASAVPAPNPMTALDNTKYTWGQRSQSNALPSPPHPLVPLNASRHQTTVINTNNVPNMQGLRCPQFSTHLAVHGVPPSPASPRSHQLHPMTPTALPPRNSAQMTVGRDDAARETAASSDPGREEETTATRSSRIDSLKPRFDLAELERERFVCLSG